MKKNKKKKAAEEATKKEEEERKKKEDEEIKKKQKENEGLRLTGSKKDQQTTDPMDTPGKHDHTDQHLGQDNPYPQDPTATSGSTQGKDVFSGMNLVPFM